MYLMVIILNRPELLKKLLTVMKKNGAKGATVLDSMGQGAIMKSFEEDRPMIASIKKLKEDGLFVNKTILSVIEDKKKLQDIADAVEREIGSFAEDSSMGIMFSVPLNMVRGGKLGRYDGELE
ncbi:P-II family nitrogen regulator [Thermosediminibacter litoriperuensis]|uniref:Nitrogen regulatory protein P-II family n=1 Tax=Thermosediminibacter litoriperuensis TaxID=291989 RepID=A0A5S5B0T2_9FIRM|nr:hypothetical protein [Thermosediminibacter litoriperuensis]TYP58836.1 hypothetical protein LZ11_00292 [Thermosediminibacter litoriperuensis]